MCLKTLTKQNESLNAHSARSAILKIETSGLTYRFLATKKGLDLGPWSRRVSAEEVKQDTHASTILRDVLTSYESGTFTF